MSSVLVIKYDGPAKLLAGFQDNTLQVVNLVANAARTPKLELELIRGARRVCIGFSVWTASTALVVRDSVVRITTVEIDIILQCVIIHT